MARCRPGSTAGPFRTAATQIKLRRLLPRRSGRPCRSSARATASPTSGRGCWRDKRCTIARRTETTDIAKAFTSGGPCDPRAVAACDCGSARDFGDGGGSNKTVDDDPSRAATAAGTEPVRGGRSAADDLRICRHEAGHAVVGRAIGQQIRGATIDPRDGVEGLILWT